MAATPRYDVVIREFDGTTDFGPGSIATIIENAKNIGWAEYVNDVGEAFVTINQDDPKANATMREMTRDGGHFELYRNGDQVFGGFIGETDEKATDAILYAYSYVSGLFLNHTAWGATWSGETVGQIVEDNWDRVHTVLDSSLMRWMTKGTIQIPPTTSDGSTAIILPRYEANYKRILFVMQEMVAISKGETTNRAMFEITPTGTFNFWKDKGTIQTGVRWAYGDNRVLDFSRIRRPLDRRNVLHVVGASPRDVLLRVSVTDTDDRDTKGRREEAIFLEWVRDEEELWRVARLRAKLAKRDDSYIALSFKPGTVEPFRSASADYYLTDSVKVHIQKGITNISEYRMIVGQQVALVRGQEVVRPLLEDQPA
jgi:hypothetical protein